MSRVPEEIELRAFASYGVNIGIRAELIEAVGSFERFLPFGCKRATARELDRVYSVTRDASGKFKLYADARKAYESYEIEDLLLRFQAHAQLFIAANARQRAFIHAGVVAVDNRAILIPGRSYAGKTTLVAEFIKAGAVYYSDEYAVLDRLGRAHPYPKPLSMRNKSSGKQRDITAEDLGAQTGFAPAPVGIILITRYKGGATWKAKEVDSGAGIKALVMNSVSIRQAPESTLRSIARAASGALILKSDRGDARSMVKELMKNFRGRS